MKSRTSSRAWFSLVVSAMVASFAIAGCGGSEDKVSDSVRAGGEPSTGLHEDFQPVGGPAALEKMSSVVVEGVTGDPQEGRIWGSSAKDPGAITSIVVPIQVSKVLAGEVDPASNGTVFLELFASDGPDRASIEKGLVDRDGVFYLYRMPDRLSKYTEIVDLSAGRPSGQPLYQPASPQGTFIESSSDNGVWSVGTSEWFPSASLDDVAPDAKSFPATESREVVAG